MRTCLKMQTRAAFNFTSSQLATCADRSLSDRAARRACSNHIVCRHVIWLTPHGQTADSGAVVAEIRKKLINI